MKHVCERERKREWVTGSEEWKELGILQFPNLHIIANKTNYIYIKELAVFPAETGSCDCTVCSELESCEPNEISCRFSIDQLCASFQITSNKGNESLLLPL